MNTRLRFWNLTQVLNHPDVVIAQRPLDRRDNRTVVVWRVIRRCAHGCYRPFSYDSTAELTVSDVYGNYSPHQPAAPGSRYGVSPTFHGRRLYQEGSAANSDALQVHNGLPKGTLRAHLVNRGRVIATAGPVGPGQNALFIPHHHLCVATLDRVCDGQHLAPGDVHRLTTEFDIYGIASADLIMVGGGFSTDSKPFSFTMENIRWY